MFKHKRLLIVTLLCVFAALPTQVLACSLVPLAVNIHCRTHSDIVGKKICIGGDCSATFERESGGARLTNSALKDSIYSSDQGVVLFDPARTPLVADAVLVIEQMCTEDLSAIRTQFIQAIEDWSMKGNDSRFGGNLVLTPYSAAEESRLGLARDTYTDCYYAEFERVGDWLLSNQTMRSYCVVNRSLSLSFACPTAELSYMYFLGFLLTHISQATLPYLAGYLLGIVVLVGMVVIVYRRGFLRAFRPTIWTILGALAGSIALSVVGSFVNFFVYLIIIYIVLCFSRGMLTRKHT